jgi:hypothetical protein
MMMLSSDKARQVWGDDCDDDAVLLLLMMMALALTFEVAISLTSNRLSNATW